MNKIKWLLLIVLVLFLLGINYVATEIHRIRKLNSQAMILNPEKDFDIVIATGNLKGQLYKYNDIKAAYYLVAVDLDNNIADGYFVRIPKQDSDISECEIIWEGPVSNICEKNSDSITVLQSMRYTTKGSVGISGQFKDENTFKFEMKDLLDPQLKNEDRKPILNNCTVTIKQL